MSLKILQWNCMYSEDIENIARLIGRLNPDIIFLQELTLGYHQKHVDTGKFIIEALDLYGHYSYGPMVLPDGLQAQMGMGIFSRYPLQGKQKIILQTGLFDANQRLTIDERFFLQSSIQVEGLTIGLGTTHLPFHPRFRTTPIKQTMVESIINASNKYTNYIFGADLNTTPFTKAAVTFRKNGFRNAGPSLVQPTWTTKPFSIGNHHYNELTWRLDYLLTKGTFKTKGADIISTDLSDHLPILIEIS